MVSRDGPPGSDASHPAPDVEGRALVVWVTGAVTGTLVALAALGAWAPRDTVPLGLPVLAGAAAALAILLGAARHSRLWPADQGDLGFALLSMLLSVVGGAFLWGTGDPLQVTTVLVAVLVAGTALPRLPWFLGAASVTWAAALLGFSGAYLDGGLEPGVGGRVWGHAALALVAATVLAAGTRTLRATTIDTLIHVHQQADTETVRDPLTGTANRRGLEMVAIPMIENARRQGEAVHCLFIDLDAFRTVNETLGTSRGDGVLSAVAEALRASIRTTDVLARWAGDEFVIIGPGTGTSPLEMERRVRSRLAADPPVPLDVWKGRVSVGSATLVPWDDGDLHSLLRRADQDMALRRSLRRHSSLPRRQDPPPSTSAKGHPVQEKGDKGPAA